MHLKSQPFALAAALAMGIAYIACTAFVAIFPELSSALIGWLMHLENVERNVVSWISFLGGLVQVLLYTYLVALIFAGLHNKFVER